MDAQLDTVIQDLQGAIGLDDSAGGLTARKEAWRAHPLYVAKPEVTVEPKRARRAVVMRGGEEGVTTLDPLTQRLAP